MRCRRVALVDIPAERRVLEVQRRASCASRSTLASTLAAATLRHCMSALIRVWTGASQPGSTGARQTVRAGRPATASCGCRPAAPHPGVMPVRQDLAPRAVPGQSAGRAMMPSASISRGAGVPHRRRNAPGSDQRVQPFTVGCVEQLAVAHVRQELHRPQVHDGDSDAYGSGEGSAAHLVDAGQEPAPGLNAARTQLGLRSHGSSGGQWTWLSAGAAEVPGRSRTRPG